MRIGLKPKVLKAYQNYFMMLVLLLWIGKMLIFHIMERENDFNSNLIMPLGKVTMGLLFYAVNKILSFNEEAIGWLRGLLDFFYTF